MKELVQEFPTLYGTEKNGKTRVWNASVWTDNGRVFCTTEYGQLNGRMQTASRDYTVGTNQGKKNEKTPLQQCIAETTKKWKDKQAKENYRLKDVKEGTTSHRGIIYPMLAHKYDGKSTNIFPCFVQPKMDGVRCILYRGSEGNLVCQSRTGGAFERLDHIVNALKDVFEAYPDLVLDGELYTDEMPFEELVGLVKTRRVATDEKELEKIRKISYHIFDIINDLPFEERWKATKDVERLTLTTPIRIVETRLVRDKDEFSRVFAEFTGAGLEGIILRVKRGKYCLGHRSRDLLKYKEGLEDEFEIVGFKEGEGREKGAVLWICTNGKGNTFAVRPRGTLKDRQDLFREGKASEHVGKALTVLYQEMTEHGIPRFPVGKGIREGY